MVQYFVRKYWNIRSSAVAFGIVAMVAGVSLAIGPSANADVCNGSKKSAAVTPSLNLNIKDFNDVDTSCENDPAKCAFSFRKTLEAIVASAGLTFDKSTETAILQSLADTFKQSSSSHTTIRGGHFVAQNRLNGLLTPVERILDGFNIKEFRVGDKDFTDKTEYKFKPLAVFNRFDKARNDFLHCGEHRIVYHASIRQKPFYLIFEGAMLPNSSQKDRQKGCRDIAEFWANLSTDSDTATSVKRLEELFYKGTAAFKGIGGKIIKIKYPKRRGLIDYRNYGSGPTGQIRGNILLDESGNGRDGRWHMREWRLLLKNRHVNFRMETLKENAFAEFYRDNYDASGAPWAKKAPWAAGNKDVFDREKFRFKLGLSSRFEQMNVIRDRRYFTAISTFVDTHKACLPSTFNTDIHSYSLSQGMDLNLISNKIDDRFNEFQSSVTFEHKPADPYDDVFPQFTDTTSFRSLLKSNLDWLKLAGVVDAGIKTKHVFNRAYFTSCAGCHAPNRASSELSPGLHVQESSDFVHVNDQGGNSEILEKVFLPWRQIVLSYFLFDASPHLFEALEPQYPDQPPDLVLLKTLVRLQEEVLIGFPREIEAKINAAVSILRKRDRNTGGAFMPYRRPH